MARILLAEPDPAIREFIAGILAEFGHDVMTSANATEAKVWIATSPFDVLVTDLVLQSEQGVNLSRDCAALGIRTITLIGREYHADQSEAAPPCRYWKNRSGFRICNVFWTQYRILAHPHLSRIRRATPPDIGESAPRIGRYAALP